MSAGRFEITEILGAGAYAVVCVAVDADTGSQVALKILRKESRNDVDAVDRLRDEARILMALRHPNIPAVTELLDYDGRPVVVMEHVRGVACDVLRKAIGEALTPGMVLQLAGQVAVGLDYAWNTPDADEPMRIVHRDLKPSNVVLSQDGVVKIIDFGIAKGSFDGRAAKSLFVVHGSQGYEAPERWLGVGDRPSVDVYGLAALVLDLLTGHVPTFSRKPDAHRDGVLRHLDQIDTRGRVDDGAVRDLLRAMLQHQEDARPPMRDVAIRLREILRASDARPDPRAFAAEHVEPIVAARHRGEVQDHEAYDQIRFLQVREPTPTLPALSTGQVAGEVRRFVRSADWEQRVPELQQILSRSERFVTRPLIEVLDRAWVPWWKVWERPARPSELEAALLLLCDQDDDAVTRRARALLRHQDSRVVAAARFLLVQRGGT